MTECMDPGRRHAAARFLERFGLEVGLNELLWIEREVQSGAARRVGVQEAREAGDGHRARRERHIYSVAIKGNDVRIVYDPEARRVVSCLPPEWRAPTQRREEGAKRRLRGGKRGYTHQRRHGGRKR